MNISQLSITPVFAPINKLLSCVGFQEGNDWISDISKCPGDHSRADDLIVSTAANAGCTTFFPHGTDQAWHQHQRQILYILVIVLFSKVCDDLLDKALEVSRGYAERSADPNVMILVCIERYRVSSVGDIGFDQQVGVDTRGIILALMFLVLLAVDDHLNTGQHDSRDFG